MKRLFVFLAALIISVVGVSPAMATIAGPESRTKGNFRIPQQLIIGGNLNNTGWNGPSLVFRPLSSGVTTYDTTIQCSTPSAARTYTIPDAGGSASFVLTGGSGSAPFANTGLKVYDTGGDHYITIAPASDEAANRTLSIPTLGANASIIVSVGAQTKAGVLTLSSAPVLSTATFTSSGDTITIQDLGSANLVQSEGAQTINGVKTFGSIPIFPASTVTSANIVSGSAKRIVFHMVLSPNTGAAVDSTVYSALVFPGRAGTVKRISYGAQLNPTVGVDVIKVLKGSSAGNTMLSTASVDANGITANQATTATLTATGADLATTASGAGSGIYAEYNAGSQTQDAIGVAVDVEFEFDDF